jgi:hypothetical protein
MFFNTKAYTSPTLNYEISIHDILSLSPLCLKKVKIILPTGTGCFIKQIPVQAQGWDIGGTKSEYIEINNGGGEGVLEFDIEGFDIGETPKYDVRIYANGFKSLYIRASKVGETIYLQGQF